MEKWNRIQKIQFILMIILFTPVLLIIGYPLAIIEVKKNTIKNLERGKKVNGR